MKVAALPCKRQSVDSFHPALHECRNETLYITKIAVSETITPVSKSIAKIPISVEKKMTNVNRPYSQVADVFHFD